jgi:nucleotide-binding universal stress UspA family protein
MKRIRRIMHPSDFSPASGPAFTGALEMAKSNRAELLVVHVLNPVIPIMGGGDYVSPLVYQDLERSIQAHARRQLDALLARARKARVTARGFLLEGRPFQEIARAAKSKRADLIVMGTHGRGGLAKLFLGNVAERVIATAHCPVLTIKAPLRNKSRK